MKEISLTRGYVALVDDEDFDKISGFSWYPKFEKGRIYAVTSGSVRMHRLVVGCVPFDGVLVDHHDLNGLNNQKGNLRKATVSQNSANRNKHVRTDGKATSRYKGVTAVVKEGKQAWEAAVAGTRLGVFLEEVDAALAYNLGAEELYGSFARLNV